MKIKTKADAASILSSVDAALDRLVTQGIQNAFIVAGAHNDITAVIEYLNAKPDPAPTPETEKE